MIDFLWFNTHKSCSFCLSFKVDVRHKNGEPADNIPIEIEAQTDQGVAVSESATNGNVNSDRSNELGHGRFVIDVPRTFTVVHLNIRV